MLVVMETIPITEAKARIAELADRVAREHDHSTMTRNGIWTRSSKHDPAQRSVPMRGELRKLHEADWVVALRSRSLKTCVSRAARWRSVCYAVCVLWSSAPLMSYIGRHAAALELAWLV